MVNVETLNLLQQFWRKYSIYTDPDRRKYDQFQMDCKTAISRMKPLLQTPWLTRSFGPRVHESTPIAAHYTSKFWKSGTVDSRGQVQSRQCNPLFVFSSLANDKFAVHWSSNPLCGFHLAPSITELTRESSLHHWDNGFGRIDGERAFESALITAQKQFAAWCKAFQNLSRKVIDGNSQGGGLRIRIFVGDAVEFCLALASPVNSYSRPYTVNPLRLDGAIPTANDGALASFNVIDISTLPEFVGSINLLTATIPLLEKSPSSVLYMETLRPDLYDDETKLLSDVLRTDNVRSICTLLGLVPVPYITAVSTRSKTQSEVISNDTKVPSLNRIPWKFTTSMDPNSLVAKTACDPNSLATLLYNLYLKMFSHESIDYFQRMLQRPTNPGAIRFPPLIYSRRSYAALLAFLKPRIVVDWNEFMRCLLGNVESDSQLMLGRNSIQELFLQLHLAGVYSRHPVGQSIGNLSIPGHPPLSRYRHDRGILKDDDPPCVTCLIISIPRRKLHILYKSSVDEGIRVSMMFQINILTKMFHNTFSSIHPVFGKLAASDDGQTCTIEEDIKGWHGSADLHLCVYLPTYMLLMTDPREMEVSVRLQPDGSTTMAFRTRLGIELEVFKSRLLDKNHVQLLRSFPGLETPRPPTIVPMGKKLMVSNDKMELTYPELLPERQTFTTRNTFRGKEEREQLKSGAAVAFKVASLCSVIITFGTVEYTVNFPYPIEDHSNHIRIARKSGWIEVIATLLPPPIEASFSRDPFPLVRIPNHGVLTWNLPYINLRGLPEINVPVFPGGRKSWLVAHSNSMFSDYHTPQKTKLLQKSHLLGDVKLVIEAMIAYVGGVEGVPERVWRIDLVDQPELAVFIDRLYLDNCSHTVVAEAYVLPLMNLPPHLRKTVDQFFTNALASKSPSDTLKIFKRGLRAMAERCRDWEHSETCEFVVGETIPDVEDGKSPFCSCGVGKVQKDFRQGQWKDFSQYVTRVAITPIFAVPYMEPAKTVLREFTGGPRIAKEQLRDTKLGPICQACGNEGHKKCSRCEEAYYCGRECQVKDWQKHKAICRKSGS